MQQLVIENLELRISSILSDLDPDEQKRLGSDMKSLKAEYTALGFDAKAFERDLDRAMNERQLFESQLDEIQRKLSVFVAQSQGYELLSLSSASTEKVADKFKVNDPLDVMSPLFFVMNLCCCWLSYAVFEAVRH